MDEFVVEKLTEEDIKRIKITPEIDKSGWTNYRMEYFFTDGRIVPNSNGGYTRGKRKKADYLLRNLANLNLAIVEAKDGDHTPETGLLQAIEYAKILNVPFAYSSNGDAFVEHDMITGVERTLLMDQFPTPTMLEDRYKLEKGFTDEQLNLIQEPFHYSPGFKPRYYQTASVDKTLEAIASGSNRVLVVMATGTGKTFTAFQIAWKLTRQKKVKKILYLADRRELIRKPYNDEFSPFGIHRCIIKNHKIDTAYDVFFGLYQQLDSNGNAESNLDVFKQVTPDFFDLIFVDECHRGSAKEDSKWREVLNYFSSAIQIGMTATPKVYGTKGEDGEPIVDTAKLYFGEPVYVYSLKAGIEDGYLAPFKAITPHLDIDVNGYRPYKGEVDIYGNLLEDRIYTTNDFDKKLIVDSRTKTICEKITQFMKENGRYEKTIIFCCNIPHAERMRTALNNMNLDITRTNPKYIVRITGDSPTADADLEAFTKVEFNKETDPCIAITSDLMTTGIDCKTAKVIIIDKVINSMTTFKQIIGRGTRIRMDAGKFDFTIIDFRQATRLFADPRWDGDLDIIPEGQPRIGNDGGDGGDGEEKVRYHIHGDEVTILGENVAIMDSTGKVITTSLINYTKSNILNEYATLDSFIQTWTSEKKHKAIIQELESQGVLLDELRKEIGIEDMDDFDLICHIAYGLKPRTRSERANSVKKSELLDRYQGAAREVLEKLLDKYCDDGIEDIDDINVLKLDEFKEYGTPKQIINDVFGGRDEYISIVTAIKANLYSVGA